MSERKYCCPKCGLQNIIKATVLYEQGHTTGSVVNREVVGEHRETGGGTDYEGKEYSYERTTPIYGNVRTTSEYLTDAARAIAAYKPVSQPPTVPKVPILPVRQHFTEEDNSSVWGGFALLTLLISLFVSTQFGISFGVALFLLFLSGWFLNSYLAKQDLKVNTTRAQQEYEKAEKEYNERLKRYMEVEMPEYEIKKQKYDKEWQDWEHLYKCNTCGNVFTIYD